MPFLRARPFGCAQLEALFRHQLVHRSAGDLLRLLSVLVPLQLVLALFRVPQPDPALLWLAGSASLGLALALGLACSPPSAQHPLIPLCALWLCAHPLLLLPWPSLAFLPSILAIPLLYAFFPFPLLCAVLIASSISVAQLGAMASFGELGLAKVIAAFLAHLWAHLVGIYALCTGRKIGRAVFLNARNALDSDRELQGEVGRMANLLSGSLPPHIVQSVQAQLGSSEVPRVFVEHFSHSSVVFARLYGLPSILAQLQVLDSARLLNEFEWRLRGLADANGLLLVPSAPETVLALSGVPSPRPDHAAATVQFGADLVALFHSFSTATTAQLQVRVGIGSGSLSTGIVGSRRWHFDVLGMAVDAAMYLEGTCPAGSVLLSEDTWRRLDGKFAAERLAQGAWQIKGPPSIGGGANDEQQRGNSSTAQPWLFTASPRRFSLLTLQQAVLRLLQHPPRSSPIPSTAPITPFSGGGKRKELIGGGGSSKKAKIGQQQIGSCRQLDSLVGPLPPGLHPLSLHFADPKLERTFHAQPDRWLIPGLALCVLFLALFGLFQALAMPRMLPNLATLGLALSLMFLLLLALYVNFLESFCQFVTRTALGHCIAVLLVLAALCTCGFATTFSCPQFASQSAICQPAQFPAVSLALWMLLASVFVRLSSLLLLLVLLASIGIFCLHLFLSHPGLYPPDLLSRLDLAIALLALALLIFVLARRNELLLRMDFLALLKAVEDGRRLERVEFYNDQILMNALPAHIAFNFAARSDPYAHLCPSVGVLCARLGRSGDWVGEFGFDRLNRLVCEIDQRLGQLSERRIEKVRTGHCYYTAACGILPEMANNVNDAPCTIGEQLATLGDLAEFIQELAESEGLEVAIGLDCGSALSVVVGADKPHYELLGQPCTRAKKLTEAASALGGGCVLLSEDVFLALRPRSQFRFDERSALSVGPGLIAYSLLRAHHSPSNSATNPQNPPKEEEIPSPPAAALDDPLPPIPPPHRGIPAQIINNENAAAILHQNGPPKPPFIPPSAFGRPPLPGGSPRIRANPLAAASEGRAFSAAISASSAQSLCSTELFSVDLSVETDSLELEWVTPEMVANGQYRPFPEPMGAAASVPQNYKGERAGFYSELSVAQGSQSQMNSPGKNGGGGSGGMKKRHFRGMPSWKGGMWRSKSRRSSGANTSAFGSELSLPNGTNGRQMLPIDRLNLAAKKVDRMLKEMAGIQGPDAPPDCPFPNEVATENGGSINGGGRRRESSGARGCQCLSEYENGGSRASLACCSESDAAFAGVEIPASRLDRLRRALLVATRGAANGGGNVRQWFRGGGGGDGNEADRSSSPSAASSQFFQPPQNSSSRNAAAFLGAKWRHSAHSIGYDDEYELASAPFTSIHSSSISLGWDCGEEGTSKIGGEKDNELPSVGQHSRFAPIDADEGEGEVEGNEGQRPVKAMMDKREETVFQKEMLELSRNICRNFGDFQLATFSDEEFPNGIAGKLEGK